jgi:hypothetical protein
MGLQLDRRVTQDFFFNPARFQSWIGQIPDRPVRSGRVSKLGKNNLLCGYFSYFIVLKKIKILKSFWSLVFFFFSFPE